MSECTQESLRFPPVEEGLSVRADFDRGALSTDFGSLILRGVDRQIGLTERLTAAFDDRRHPSCARLVCPTHLPNRVRL